MRMTLPLTVPKINHKLVIEELEKSSSILFRCFQTKPHESK